MNAKEQVAKLQKEIDDESDDQRSASYSLIIECRRLAKLGDVKKTEMEIPKLPIPASREDCRLAMEQMFGPAEKRESSWRPALEEISKKLATRHWELRVFENKVDGLLNRHRDLTVHMWWDFLMEWKDDVEEAMELAERRLKRVENTNLQLAVQSLVEGQDEDLKRWFFTECLPYARHLDKKTGGKPSVILDKERRSSESRHLPPDVMLQIFNHCNLETCVALRETSSSWYAAFKHVEHILETKVKLRNPWMKPEPSAGISNWADCALVFVRRLSGNKWSSTTRVSEALTTMNYIRDRFSGHRHVIPTRLKKDEKIIAGFQPLQKHDSNMCDREDCELLHLKWGKSTFLIDPTTMESRVINNNYLSAKYTSEEVVISGPDNLKITLPAQSLSKESIASKGSIPVHVFARHVTVSTATGTLLFTRDRPLHYDNAIECPVEGYGREAGHVHFIEDSKGNKYHFFDPHRRIYVEFPSTGYMCDGKPVAVYNGLIWWSNEGQDRHVQLFPTFVDLENPTKIYFRKNCDMSIPLVDSPRPSQVTGSDNLRMVTAKTAAGIVLVDLETITVTRLPAPEYERADDWFYNHRMFPGYLDGKFHAWFIDNKTTKEYMREAWDLTEEQVARWYL